MTEPTMLEALEAFDKIALDDVVKKCANHSDFPPMVRKVPTPFGKVAKEIKPPSSGRFPPMATKATTSLGQVKKEIKQANSSGFYPMAKRKCMKSYTYFFHTELFNVGIENGISFEESEIKVDSEGFWDEAEESEEEEES